MHFEDSGTHCFSATKQNNRSIRLKIKDVSTTLTKQWVGIYLSIYNQQLVVRKIADCCKSQVFNGVGDIYSNNIPLPEKRQWKTVKYNEMSWTFITLLPLRHIVSNPWGPKHRCWNCCKSQVFNGVGDIYSVKYNEMSWTFITLITDLVILKIVTLALLLNPGSD